MDQEANEEYERVSNQRKGVGMRRERMPDVKSLGGSALTAHLKRLPSLYRHKERLKINLEHEKDVRDWCRAHRFTLAIREDGRHWKLAGPTAGGFVFVEWWPANARLVFNGRDGEGVHCHDYQQLLKALEEGAQWRSGYG